jgi:hypothetical protein
MVASPRPARTRCASYAARRRSSRSRTTRGDVAVVTGVHEQRLVAVVTGVEERRLVAVVTGVEERRLVVDWHRTTRSTAETGRRRLEPVGRRLETRAPGPRRAGHPRAGATPAPGRAQPAWAAGDLDSTGMSRIMRRFARSGAGTATEVVVAVAFPTAAVAARDTTAAVGYGLASET